MPERTWGELVVTFIQHPLLLSLQKAFPHCRKEIDLWPLDCGSQWPLLGDLSSSVPGWHPEPCKRMLTWNHGCTEPREMSRRHPGGPPRPSTWSRPVCLPAKSPFLGVFSPTCFLVMKYLLLDPVVGGCSAHFWARRASLLAVAEWSRTDQVPRLSKSRVSPTPNYFRNL